MGKTKGDMTDKQVKKTIEPNWRTPRVPTGGTPKQGYTVRPSGNPVQEELGRQAGTGKLNPAWVEQLMGLPPQWTQLSGVTDPNENRIDRLRLLGNGCIPAQVEKAFRTLTARFK